jgi:hypothetical protein
VTVKQLVGGLINAMGDAGTQDLRGVQVLPYALRIIGSPPADLAPAVSELQTWVATGAHRINRARPGAHGSYDQSGAIRIIDAWWPLLIGAEFQPVLGQPLLSSVEGEFAINDQLAFQQAVQVAGHGPAVDAGPAVSGTCAGSLYSPAPPARSLAHSRQFRRVFSSKTPILRSFHAQGCTPNP